MYIKKYKDFILLNYIILVIYFIVFVYMNLEINDGHMFSTVDSYTYRSTSMEFYKLTEKGFSELRPFLYPLIILTVGNLFGVYGIWILQFIFWLLSVNFLFAALKTITAKKWLGWLGALYMAFNVSYIVLTTDALTESFSIFLISILIYFISKNLSQIRTARVFNGVILILVLLCVTKPIFYVHIMFLLLIVFPFFYLKRFVEKPKSFIMLLLCLLPLVYQVAMMKLKYNTFSVSNIDTDSFRAYLMAQGVEHNNNISLEEARAITRQMSTGEVLSYLTDNLGVYTKIYLTNLYNAIHSLPCFIMYPNSYYQSEVIYYMQFVNGIYFYTHLVFIPIVLIFIFLCFRSSDLKEYLFPIILFSMLSYYILLMTGFSFNEGDRHGIISLPLWIFIYIVTGQFIWNRILKRFSM